jgi:hypothetical protein
MLILSEALLLALFGVNEKRAPPLLVGFGWSLV